MQANAYSNGTVCASVDQDRIKASWGRGDGCGARIESLNKAFRLFYVFRNRIEQVAKRDIEAWLAMLRQLEDAGDTGWGRGVWDLDDAFRHLLETGGTWTDENTRPYWGLRQPSVYYAQVLGAPAAAANFLTALNGKLDKLRNLHNQYLRAVRSADPPRSKLQQIKLVADQANALSWLLPEELTPEDWYNLVSNVMEALDKAIDLFHLPLGNLQPWLERLGKITDWLGEADKAVQVFVEGRKAGMPPGLAAGWSALGTVLTHVPWLGSFYGEIVNQTPGLVGNMRRLAQERQRRLDRAAAGAAY